MLYTPLYNFYQLRILLGKYQYQGPAPDQKKIAFSHHSVLNSLRSMRTKDSNLTKPSFYLVESLWVRDQI